MNVCRLFNSSANNFFVKKIWVNQLAYTTLSSNIQSSKHDVFFLCRRAYSKNPLISTQVILAALPEISSLGPHTASAAGMRRTCRKQPTAPTRPCRPRLPTASDLHWKRTSSNMRLEALRTISRPGVRLCHHSTKVSRFDKRNIAESLLPI